MTLRSHAAETEIRATPLHTRLAAANRANQWCEWNGFTYPMRTMGLAAELHAARDTAALADVSPRARYRVTGKDAATYLARLLTRDAAAMPLGAVAETLWCADNGLVRGLGTVARVGEREFLLVGETPDGPWLDAGAFGFEVEIEDATLVTAALTLIGPQAAGALEFAGLEAAAAVNRGATASLTGRGIAMKVLRAASGDRFDLLAGNDDAAALWDLLDRALVGMDGGPIGFEALDVIRIEAGLPAPHRDFVPAQFAETDASAVTPFALGLKAWVDLDRGHFNGRRALKAPGALAGRRELKRLLIDGQGDAAYAPVLLGPREAGHTVTAHWSPRANATAALAWLDPGAQGAKERLSVLQTTRDGMRRADRYVPARIV